MTQGIERWRNRVAVITGASSGIGTAVARALAQAGMRVALAARRADRLEALASELRAGGAEVLVVPTDVRDEASILALFARVRERLGGVDVMINNAGLGRRAPLASADTELWREMLEVNLLGLCICTREALRDMQARGSDGHIVHLSSMAAHRVPQGSGVYAATKFGVRALTEALRQELHEARSPVRVSAVSPGLVETEFAAVYNQSEEAARKAYSRLKVLEAEDVAAAVVFVLSQPPHAQVHDILLRPREQAN
jgi:NADP-dependent 3-hydroxy acid dehydrogenase YdfG